MKIKLILPSLMILIAGCATVPEIDCATIDDKAKQLKCRDSQLADQANAHFLNKYAGQIQAKISSRWRTPKGEYPAGLTVEVAVMLGSTGEVLNIDMITPSGYPEVDRSAKAAVLAASPLPIPSDPKLYTHYRKIVIVFAVPHR